MTRTNWVLGLFGIAIIGVSAIAAWKYVAMHQGSRDLDVNHNTSDKLAYKNLETEMTAFQERLEILVRDPKLQRAKGQELSELTKRLEEMRRQADRLEFRQGREEHMLDLAAQISSQSADTSIGMVSFVSALFVIVVFGVSLGTSLQFKDLKEDFSSLQEQMEAFKRKGEKNVEEVAQKVQMSQKQMEVELERLELLTKSLSEQTDAGGVFLDGLVNVHAEAFSEILSTLPLGRISSEEESHRVRLKGKELQGRLLLLHPDRERRKKAVMLLGAVGTKIAKSDLRRLQKDRDTDKDMALLIESAIRKIDEQMPKQKK